MATPCHKPMTMREEAAISSLIQISETVAALLVDARPVQERVSKGEKDSRRPPAPWAGHPPNGRKVVWGVARPQGV
jgi:hypothetical protein